MAEALFEKGPISVVVDGEATPLNAGYPLCSYGGQVSAIATHPRGARLEVTGDLFGGIARAFGF